MFYLFIHTRHAYQLEAHQVGMECHKVHIPDAQSVVVFQYVAVQVLLQAIVVIRRILKVFESLPAPLPTVRVGQLRTALPVVDVEAFTVAAHKVDGSCHALRLVEHPPFHTERIQIHAVEKTPELRHFVADVKLLVHLKILSTIGKIIAHFLLPLQEEVLNLCVHVGSHLACRMTFHIPFLFHEALLHIAVARLLCRPVFAVERLEKMAYHRADRRQACTVVERVLMQLFIKENARIVAKAILAVVYIERNVRFT